MLEHVPVVSSLEAVPAAEFSLRGMMGQPLSKEDPTNSAAHQGTTDIRAREGAGGANLPVVEEPPLRSQVGRRQLATHQESPREALECRAFQHRKRCSFGARSWTVRLKFIDSAVSTCVLVIPRGVLREEEIE